MSRVLFAAIGIFLILAYSQAHAAYSPVAGIEFDSTIPADQYALMTRDLQALQALELGNPDPKMAEIMGLQDSSSQALLNWLTDRVHYIVSETFDPFSQTVSTTKYRNFPFSDEFPDSSASTYGEIEFAGLQASSAGTLVTMSNIGGALYASSKRVKLIRTISIPGVENVTISSPRVGIIKIGQGLFNKNLPGLGRVPETSRARIAHHLGALFHEARHSDGHGKSLAFSHSYCPPEHHFAGLPACDRNLNGPYSVQAHFLNSLSRSCSHCSPREIDMIRMLAVDAMGRVIPAVSNLDSSHAKDPVATKLRSLTRTLYLCKSSQEMGWSAVNPTTSCDASQLGSQIAQIQASRPDIVIKESQVWDASPERIYSPLK